jgi:hypothetical protein
MKFTNMKLKVSTKLSVVLFFAAVVMTESTWASHFRGASATYSISAANVLTVQITSVWRADQIDPPAFSVFTGLDGTGTSVGAMTLTSTTNPFFSGSEFASTVSGASYVARRDTFTKTLPASGTYYARWSSSARVASINNAGQAQWEIELTVVHTDGQASSGPTVNDITVDQVPKIVAFNRTLGASDPDGSIASIALVAAGENAPNYGPASQIPGINISSGVVNIPAVNTSAMATGRWVYKLVVTDNSGGTAVQDLMVILTPLNLTTTTSTSTPLSYTENDPATIAEPGVTVASVGTTITSATVRLTTGFASGDLLEFSNQNGITGSYNSSTGVLTLSGSGSDANYQTAVRSVTFRSTSDNPVSSKVISIQTSDGTFLSPIITRSIVITAVNDAPTVTAPATIAPLQNIAKAFTGADTVSVTDPDAGSASVAVTLAVNQGTLSLTAGTATVSGNSSGSMSVSGTVAAVNTALATLTYQGGLNYVGTDTLTIGVNDGGNTGTGGTLTGSGSVAITVSAINTAPSFTKGADQSVFEDAGAQTATGWATSISAGPAVDAAQTLTFQVSNNNNTLFAAQPAISSAGVLTYTPAANANGSATVTVSLQDSGGTANGGVDTSAAQTFTITVTAVNDAPSFTKGADQTVLEEATGQTVANWATVISAGPSDESGQTMTFQVSNNNNALFSVQPDISTTGTLTYTPAANANGSATVTVSLQDTGGTANSGANTSAAQTFTITVTAVNDVPSFTKGADQTAFEDATAQTVANWATAISAGPSNESAQTLTFQASNSNNALFSVQPAVSAAGTLTYTLAANANGSATVTVSLQDNAGTANGGVDTSAAQTFTITVTAVNDAPSFTKGADQTALEDATAQTVANWATSISAGPSDESGQTVSFQVSNNNNALFSVQPAISATGTLTYTPIANANGSATVTVSLQDNGGTANSGADTSAAQTFTITVTAVNDVPSFAKGADQTVLEDATAQSVANWATSISAGPSNESAQTLTFQVSNNNNALFSVQPAVSAAGTLTYTLAANANGSATVTVSLQDNGGTANSGVDTSAAQTFTITVTAVNDAPSFTKGADQSVLEDATAQTVANWATSISAGPSDESGQTLTFQVSNNNNALFSVQPAIAANGTLTYTPVANVDGSATVTVSLQDNGGTANSGVSSSAAQTFTITVTAVNDVPTLAAIGNLSLAEDTGTQTVNLSGIGAGPSNESAQTLTVTASSNLPGLIPNPAVTYTSPGATASLTFTPVANAFGTAIVSVVVEDNGGTANAGIAAVTNTFTVTLVPVNDPPTLAALGNLTVTESAGLQTVNLLEISPGPVNESASQTVSITASSSNPSLIPHPTVSYNSFFVSGSLSFTPVVNASGTATITVVATDTGGTANGGNNTTVRTFTVTVAPPSNSTPPTLAAINDVTILEDAVTQTVNLTGIAGGSSNPAGQLIVVTASSSNTNVIADPTVTYTHPNVSGTLRFTPAANASGSAVITVVVRDDGTGSNAANHAATRSFTINITPVNDGPALGTIVDQLISQNTPAPVARTVNLSGISAGPASESGQTLTVTATSSNPGLIPHPTVSYTSPNTTGTLSFTPAAASSGTATISVVVKDDGGIANGGVEAVTNRFVVSVDYQNHAPTLAAIGDRNVTEGTELRFTASASDGDGNALTFRLLPVGLPAGATIDPVTGVFSWTPTEAQGPSTNVITAEVGDNGSPNFAATRQFTVTVLEVNQPPVLASVPDQSAKRGESLALNNAATDADLPANRLTFSLGAGAPDGMTIDAANGVIRWTPGATQAAGSFPVVVQVTDDGTPPLSAQQSFTVTVSAPAHFTTIYFQNLDGSLGIWQMQAEVLRNSAPLNPPTPDHPGWRVRAIADIDRDGQSDLFLEDGGGRLAAWLMTGTNGATIKAGSFLTPSNVENGSWVVVAAVDIDKDGQVDLVFQNTDGTLAGWLMNGLTFRETRYFDPPNPGDEAWRLVGNGDFNGDGKADFIFQHTDGTIAVWLMNGTSLVRSVVLDTLGSLDAAWRVAAVTDLNQDGQLDLVLQHADESMAVLYLNGLTVTGGKAFDPIRTDPGWRIVGP